MSSLDPSSPLPITTAILAGGRSLRMGIDRALLPIDGEAAVARVAGIVRDISAHVIVVTDRPETLAGTDLAPDVSLLRDAVTHQGPLGGLATALARAEDEWVFAVGADAPWLQADIVRHLWEHRGDAQVVIPVGDSGPEPLLALYHRDCLPLARTLLAAGCRRIVAMLPELTTVEIPVHALRAEDPELRSLVNVEVLPDDGALQESALTGEAPAIRPTVVRAIRGNHDGRLPVERAITVYLNDREIATMQSSPYNLDEMALGFLLAEGLIADRNKLRSVDVDNKRGLVYVSHAEELPPNFDPKTRRVTCGGGRGVTFISADRAKSLAAVTSPLRVVPDELLSMTQELSAGGPERDETGGVHGCGFGRDGRLIMVREDIGRHNAVDKLFGRAWLDRVPTDDLVLVSNGRVSYEMALKAARARVPMVVSRKAITDLAAEVADSAGVTTVAYCRDNRMVLLTHPERVCEAV